MNMNQHKNKELMKGKRDQLSNKKENASHHHCKDYIVEHLSYLTVFHLSFLVSLPPLPPTPPTIALLPTQDFHRLLLGCVPLAAHYAQRPGCGNKTLVFSATIALRKSASFSNKNCRQRIKDLMTIVYRT